MIRESAITFLFRFIFRTFSFSHFSFHLCLFLLFLTAIDLVMCVSVRNIDVSLWQVYSCLSFGDALAFFTLRCFLTSGNVFLYYTLRTMLIQVWRYRKTLCLFVCLFICHFVPENFQKIKIQKNIVMCCWLSMITLQLWFVCHWLV
jgi:hypothetical protein